MRRPSRPLLIVALAAAALLAPTVASADVQPRIVDGSPASVAQYPWQAAVVFSPAKESGNAHQRQFCGGSLLTSRIVITAAHCVYDTDPDCVLLCSTAAAKLDPADVDVVLGRTTLSDASQGLEHAVMATRFQASYNPDYRGHDVPRFDVAYLVLTSGSGQGQIKIAGTDEGALWDADSPEEVTGWGTTSEFGDTVDTLRSAAVNVIADSACGSSSVYGFDFDAATMVCAGFLSGGADGCFGDSGGPLQAPLAGGGYRLVGITGWGDGCGEPNAPGVYTRVAGPTMRSLIQSDVSSLESTYGLPAEGIFGSGGQPFGTAVPSVATRSAKSSKARKKCKRIHNKKKRRRCVKKARKRAKART